MAQVPFGHPQVSKPRHPANGLMEAKADRYEDLAIGQVWRNRLSGEIYIIDCFLAELDSGRITKARCRNRHTASFMPRIIGVERFGTAYVRINGQD